MTSVDGMNVARYGATPIQRVIGVALLVMGLVLVPSLPGFAETGWWLLAFGCAQSRSAGGSVSGPLRAMSA